MNASDYWSIFIETGLPEAYMLYNRAKRMEAKHVSDNESTDFAGSRLQ